MPECWSTPARNSNFLCLSISTVFCIRAKYSLAITFSYCYSICTLQWLATQRRAWQEARNYMTTKVEKAEGGINPTVFFLPRSDAFQRSKNFERVLCRKHEYYRQPRILHRGDDGGQKVMGMKENFSNKVFVE